MTDDTRTRSTTTMMVHFTVPSVASMRFPTHQGKPLTGRAMRTRNRWLSHCGRRAIAAPQPA
jgi:hypothetical protein